MGNVRWDKSAEVSRVRITPQLIQVNNDIQLWSENYGQDLTQIFEVQASIAEQIVKQLGLTLVDSEKKKLLLTPTTNMAAYDLYLRGLDYSNNYAHGEFLLEAKNMFDSAIAWIRISPLLMPTNR